MAESPKQASSPATSKQKDSLLDVDFGKDFLSSWKTMSMAESDAMDFDFGPIAKGKKKAFNFDKLDVDFTLDGDLDTISSFKVDMSDLDIASPPKRPGKSKDIPKESDCGNHQKKQERFSFPFHFNELDSFSFESSLKKEGKQSNKNLNSEETSSESKCHGSGTGSIDGISASKVGLTPKLPVSVAATTSKIETPVVGFGDMDPNTKNSLSNFERNDSGPLKLSTQKVEVAAEEMRIFPENTTTSITQEKNQESHHQEKRTSPKPYAEETMQDPPVDSFSENESSQHTASDVQVENYSQATKVHSNAGGDQNDIFELVAGTGFNCENPAMANSPAQCIARSLSNDDERNKFGSDTKVSVGYAEGVEGAEGDSCSEDTPSISVSIEAMHDTSVNGDAQNENGKLRLATLSSGSSVGKVIQMKEKQTSISQSKYFKRSDEIESPSQQAPSTQAKLTMFGGERTCYGEQSSKDEGREGIDARDSPSQSKLVGISVQHSGEINKGEVVQEGSRSSVKGLNGHGSLEQTIKSTTQNYLNPRLSASGIVLSAKSSNDMLDEGRKHYSPKPGKSTLDLSSLKISSDIGAKPQPSKSTLDKEIKPLRNTVQSVEQQESTMSKIGLSVSTEKQIPSTSPLKRKAFQGLNADMLTLNPSKRLSPSATETRNSESSERGANEQVCSNKKPTDGIPYNDTNYHQTSTPDAPWEVNMTEIEIPLVLENDVNVEKADAYTKELERICNMLKKKHDEAKEVLVRAIVNNNKLLMLNHPIYEEKIRKVQKFAAKLISK